MSTAGEKVERTPLGVLVDVDGTLYHKLLMQLLVMSHFLLFFLFRPRKTWRESRILFHYRKAQEWLRAHGNGDITVHSQTERCAQVSGFGREEIDRAVHLWMEAVPLMFIRLCRRRPLVNYLRQWRSLGVPIGVYSDYPAAEKLKRLGLDSLIQNAVASTDPEIARFKPDPKGFITAARKIGTPVERTLYIGDRMDVDHAGARNAGMLSFIIRPSQNGFLVGRGYKDRLKEIDEALGKNHVAPCWICGASSTRHYRSSTIKKEVGPADVRITDDRYGETSSLAQCTGCGFIFAENMPSASMLDLYRQMDDAEYLESSQARRGQMRKLIGQILDVAPSARTVLDVGAGLGILVSEASRRGLKAEGVEPSRWCVEMAKQHMGVFLWEGTLEENSGRLGTYDVVTLIDVIEHTTDPLELIRQAKARLSANGVLAIVTPNIGSFAAKVMGRRWWHCRIAHIGYFSQRSMRKALDQTGLTLKAQFHVGWQFPIGYVVERLHRYVPLPPLRSLLTRLADHRAFRQTEVTLNLGDSLMYVAGRAET